MQPKPTTELPKECIDRDLVMQAAMRRLGDINDEVQNGYNILRKYPRTVTVFGSARTPETEKYYKKAYELSRKLAEKDFTVVSGGGHGIMAAANHGAKDGGGNSIGFNIKLPHEQTLNNFTTESLEFSHFAPRKIAMTLYANAYVFFPGGFGTLDELCEILTLTQTDKITRAPIILVGSDYWNTFDAFAKDILLDKFKMIEPQDRDIYEIVDDIDEAVTLIENNLAYC